MYVRGCPERYYERFPHGHDAIAATAIMEAVSLRTRPRQVDIKDAASNEKASKILGYEFQNKYDFRIILTRNNIAKGETDPIFILDLGKCTSFIDRAEVMRTAIAENATISLPYVHIYPIISANKHSLAEDAGIFSAYAICKDAPSADMGKILAELAITTYVKSVRNLGHFFQIDTEPFTYYHPYHD